MTKKSKDTEIQCYNLLTDPTISAAVTAGYPLVKKGMTEDEWRSIVSVLAEQIEALEEGDNTALRKLMAGQVVTLNIIFQELCKKAITDQPRVNNQLLSLALKCQRQASITAQQLARK
ncbi:MAG: hypothetical protein OXT08_04300 [Candidatus Marinimicrobia bacterium]|nr:hypothetical protein [Candidatus Neomarinimicrobiota bacterium]